METEEIIKVRNHDYVFRYFYVEDKLDSILCAKIIDNTKIFFGDATYLKDWQIVKCHIDHQNCYVGNINLDKELDELTEVLNIAKEKLLEENS